VTTRYAIPSPDGDYAIIYERGPTRLQRFVRRFFPQQQLLPMPRVDGFAPDYFISEVATTLDWRSRLRVLVSGKIVARTHTLTDKPIERAISAGNFNILPPL